MCTRYCRMNDLIKEHKKLGSASKQLFREMGPSDIDINPTELM